MKKMLKIITILFIVMIALTASKVNAASEPKLETYGGIEYFFANGTPITINERTDGNPGAKIVWGSSTMNVGPETRIIGGMHNDATPVSTSITMNGGTVYSIFGGGLHLSNTTKTEITINDGTVTSITGGGASSLTKGCGCVNGTTWYSGDPLSSPCQTEEANITINNGTIKFSVFGGGEGISNTKTANVTIKGGDLSSAWVTAGGSNGNTTTANLTITGGKINVVQGVNRGTMDSIKHIISGGEISKFYMLGETGDKDVTGYVEDMKKTTVTVNKGAKIETIDWGQNDGCGYSVGLIDGPHHVKVANGCIGNQDEFFDQTDGYVYYFANYDEIIGGKVVCDVESWSGKGFIQLLVQPDEGYTLESVSVTDSEGKNIEVEENDGVLEFAAPLSDVTVSAKFTKISNDEQLPETEKTEPKSETTTSEEKDETPKTGAFDMILYVLGAIALVSIVVAVNSKTGKYSK